MKQAKRVLSVLLCLVLLLGVLPVSALAEDAETPVAKIGDTNYASLQAALNDAANKAGDTTVELLADVDLTDQNWMSVKVSQNTTNGIGTVTLNGNDHKITGLNAPLFGYSNGGESGIVINNLTLKDVAISTTAYPGVGAFISAACEVTNVKLTNCHVDGGSISGTGTSDGSANVGGLIGYTAGYAVDDPLPVTITNCSVTDCTISGDGSVGGLIGHAGGNPATYTTITNCTVEKCKLTSSNVRDWRVGDLIGTANSGQVTVDQATVDNTKDNTRKQDAATTEAIENGLVGRAVLNNTGLLIVAGRVHVKDGLKSDTVAVVFPKNGGKMTEHSTLAEAVSKAKSGDTVVLVKDVTLNSGVTISKSITINGGGKTISAGTSASNVFPLFNVDGDNLTNVTIENCVFDIPENTQAWVAIYVQKSVDGLTIEGNTFKVHKGDGFQCIGLGYYKDRLTKNVLITGNTVLDDHTGDSQTEFVVAGQDNSNNYRTDYSTQKLTITSNLLKGTAKNKKLTGVLVSNVNGLTVTDNTFVDCYIGLCLNSCATNDQEHPFQLANTIDKIIEGNDDAGTSKYVLVLTGEAPLDKQTKPITLWDVAYERVYLDKDAETTLSEIGFNTNGGQFTSVMEDHDGDGVQEYERPITDITYVAFEGDEITLPAAPTRSGYTFAGWTAKSGSTKLGKNDTSFTVKNSMEFVAQWVEGEDLSSIGAGAAGLLLAAGSTNAPAPTLDADTHTAYVEGYPDGTVKPNGKITRAETAAILYRLMTPQSRKAYLTNDSNFHDVDFAAWYNTYVATLNAAGVITDSENGYFRPNDAITRAELAAMLAQFAKTRGGAYTFTDVTVEHWAANAIRICANLGWINGYPDGTFRPDATITRAELMAMLNRATGRTTREGTRTWRDNADKSAWYYLDVQTATND